jgi:SAM-dependent methyltransferase
MIYTYKNKVYPTYIKTGNAVNCIEPIAKQFCKGRGLDVGGYYGWTLPGSIPINIIDKAMPYDAFNLPMDSNKPWDYIFSSHCLEHLVDPIKALEYWISLLRPEGVLYLFLPHPDMEYWLPQNNRKHLHSWYPFEMAKILADIGLLNVLHSDRDMYWSFSALGFKR